MDELKKKKRVAKKNAIKLPTELNKMKTETLMDCTNSIGIWQKKTLLKTGIPRPHQAKIYLQLLSSVGLSLKPKAFSLISE